MEDNLQKGLLRSVGSRRNRRLFIGVAAVAMLTPEIALAQDDAGLTEIVVTAQRREERAQDVPISITAVSAEGLRERSVTNLQDMQASVPSLVIAPNGQASRDVMSPSIRGQSASFQGAPGVVVYMNEVPLPIGVTISSQGGPGNFVDLQSVQVLSGAQGTLFGRNTTGGAILLTPAKPTDKLEGHLSGGFGNYNMTEFEAVLNVPVSDQIRVRLVGASRDRDGFTYDVNWNKDRDDQHTRMARLGVEIEPVEGITNYTMAYYGYSKTNGTGQIAKGFNTPYFQALDQIPNGFGGFVFDFCRTAGNCNYYTNLLDQQKQLGHRKTAHGVDDFAKTETWGITNTTDIDLNDTVKLRNIISYATLKTYYSNDQDGTVAPVYDTGVTAESFKFPRDHYKLFTEELQVQGSALDNKLTYTVGGFYSKQSPDGQMADFAINVCSAKSVAACAVSTRFSGVTNESKALYAQATFDFGALTPALDRLRLTGGYRYTWDKIDGFATAWTPIPGGNLCTSQALNTNNPITDCRFGSSQKSSAPNWTIGLDYRPIDDLMVYGKVTRGYKAGGFNAYAVFPSTRSFGPEYVTDYEAGFKSDFKIGGIPTRLNVNGFYMDYSHIQRAGPDFNSANFTSGAVTLSSATAVIKGVEVEGMFKPLRELELGFNYSHTASHYKSFKFDSTAGIQDCTATSAASPPVFTGVDLSCRPLQYLSPNILSVYGRLQIPTSEKFGEVSLFVNYNWTDAQHTSPLATEKFPNGDVNEPGVDLPSFGLLNASLDWKNALDSGLDVTIFGTNLTNKLYAISNTGTFNSIGAQSQIFGEPRMYGVRLRYSFGGSN